MPGASGSRGVDLIPRLGEIPAIPGGSGNTHHRLGGFLLQEW